MKTQLQNLAAGTGCKPRHALSAEWRQELPYGSAW